MTADTDILARGATVTAREGRRLRRRHLLIIPGLAVAIFANEIAKGHGIGLGVILAFGIVPHMPALLGYGQPHARGQMATRAIPLFNVMHHPVPPLVVLTLAVVGVPSPLWLVGALVWSSHIVIDLALGDGLRTADGWRLEWWRSR